ncbi:MAG: FAD-dependent oxidoreductase [Nakamurella sp.]
MADSDRTAPALPVTERGTAAAPSLSEAQLHRLFSHGEQRDVQVGELLYAAGETPDLVVIDSGVIELVRAATPDSPAAVVATHGRGRFVGELNLLTGQNTFLSARVAEPGRVYRITPARFRQLMDTDPELSDVLLRAFLARRELMLRGPASNSFEIVGSGMTAAALALRTYAARQRLPHVWFDSDSVAGQAFLKTVQLSADELPAVVTPNRVLKGATPGKLAELVGLSYVRAADKPVDLTIIGAGPAGLAAAVYGASEGLATVLIDAVGTGGQAAASSRIENYLGFPSGLSGADLTGRAAVQALKFGAELSSPCEVVKLDCANGQLRVLLSDDVSIESRAVIIATGARYRALPLDRWADFVGAGIYYAATELEARSCGGEPVAVVGGANSAGQAAIYLAGRGNPVTLVVRGADLYAGMSSYLVERLLANPAVTNRTRSEVVGLAGDGHLGAITLNTAGSTDDIPCAGLFCFIGALPATDWLTGIALDDDGFVRTDAQLTADDLGATWSALGRAPLPFETNVPAVFAVGDVRLGSMKRVAAAVGEGASAVHSVHTAIGLRV